MYVRKIYVIGTRINPGLQWFCVFGTPLRLVCFRTQRWECWNPLGLDPVEDGAESPAKAVSNWSTLMPTTWRGGQCHDGYRNDAAVEVPRDPLAPVPQAVRRHVLLVTAPGWTWRLNGMTMIVMLSLRCFSKPSPCWNNAGSFANDMTTFVVAIENACKWTPAQRIPIEDFPHISFAENAHRWGKYTWHNDNYLI